MNAALNDPASSPDERVAALLLQRGKLKDADLVRARRLQEQDGGGLLALLGRLGLVSERDHAEACAAVLDRDRRSDRALARPGPQRDGQHRRERRGRGPASTMSSTCATWPPKRRSSGW
jgi:hypothetical protein